MYRPVTLLSISFCALSTFTSHFVRARPCVAFDIQWNLLAFGFDGKDFSAGTQDTWASGEYANPLSRSHTTDITTSGRPPFDGANTTCYLSQFANAIYVINGDASNPASVHIYDATAKSWSTQTTNTAGFDPTDATAILDHDTNVFYAISKGEMWSLNMDLLKQANSTAIDWLDNKAVQFPTDGYQPVMALAQNHIHFLDVPGSPPGSANIFVIHFSFFQPEPQSYGNFPATHGRAFDIFKNEGVQTEFAFIPDDGSATYIINVERNDTQTLPGPFTKDPLATYFASPSALVQLSPSTNSVRFFPYDPSNRGANSNAAWSPIPALAQRAVAATGGVPSGTAATASSSSTATSARGSSATGGATKANQGGDTNGSRDLFEMAGLYVVVGVIGMMAVLL
ncbi:hypothetical protein BDN71DRAFT_1567672 [Pleurotus eryngii]|uniref:Uncharacterized protein n=1 Tax=Pleurotus eryngii TaxID=5323 RepID=A0A9P6DFI5_PLEER|nr:hypothetical protein BDN71DRAFT_1567672 [Pleurotus eryngii]